MMRLLPSLFFLMTAVDVTAADAFAASSSIQRPTTRPSSAAARRHRHHHYLVRKSSSSSPYYRKQEEGHTQDHRHAKPSSSSSSSSSVWLATTDSSHEDDDTTNGQLLDTNNQSIEADNDDDDTATNGIPRGGGGDNDGRAGTNINVSKNPPPPLPTLVDYRKFALPCLGLWVSQPLLSLVDTAFVGLSGTVSQSASNLAALGPATTFFDGATYLFAFLNVATTNLYSSARAQKGEQSDQAEGVVRTASRVSLRCGIGLMVFLWAFARPLLALYIGKESLY